MQEKLNRNFQETRPANVVQKRNTSLAVVQMLGNLLRQFQLTKHLTMGSVGKTENKIERLDQLLLVPSNPMEGHLTWVHEASNHILQATTETDIRNTGSFCNYEVRTAVKECVYDEKIHLYYNCERVRN